jgi:hypothetical protein
MKTSKIITHGNVTILDVSILGASVNPPQAKGD